MSKLTAAKDAFENQGMAREGERERVGKKLVDGEGEVEQASRSSKLPAMSRVAACKEGTQEGEKKACEVIFRGHFQAFFVTTQIRMLDLNDFY